MKKLTSQELLADLHKILNTENPCVLEEESLYFPDWELRIQGEQGDSRENMVVLDFFLDCPRWDCQLHECSVGMGQEAMGMAMGGFLFGMMDAVRTMMEGKRIAERPETKFAGLRHRWTVFQSNIVGMGASLEGTDSRSYWNLLGEDLLARLGNQKLCYVKVYGAKNGDQVTGECRVNDVRSEELSQRVAEYVNSWPLETFGSQKQFFFFLQDEETFLPYPHSQAELAAHTRKAIAMFTASITQEQYERYPEALAAAVGDPHLAGELYSFLPEFCAENAYGSIDYGEVITIRRGEENISLYKSQLMSYYPIQKALHGEFGKSVNNENYGAFISVSSIWAVLQNAKSQGADLAESGGKISLCFSMPEDYVIR